MKNPVTLKYQEYTPILNACKVPYRVADTWLLSGEPVRANRWLLFISSMAVDTPGLLEKVLPELSSRRVAFRVVKNQLLQFEVNAGEMGIDNLGKVLTVYPRDIEELQALIEVLQPVTNGVRGPSLDDSIQVSKNIYVGYAEGLEPDGSPVRLSKPEKQLIPFPLRDQYPLHRKLKRIWAGRFRPYERLELSNIKASLYKCFDFLRLSSCMIKRGRIYTADDPWGRHVRHRLESEMKWMQRFQGIIPVPKVYKIFEQLGDTFLVMGLIKGVVLTQWIKELFNGKNWGDLPAAVRLLILQVFSDITGMTGKVHAEGCAICDITADNFMIPRKYIPGKLLPYAIDLELMYDFKNRKPDPHYLLGTPGYASPEQMSYQIPTAKNDLYSLGALLIYCLTAVHPAAVISKDKKEVRERLREGGINDGLIDLIQKCLSRNPMERPSIVQVQTVIQRERDKLDRKIHLLTAA